MSPRLLTALAVETVRQPRPTFGRLMSLNLPRDVLWQALALTLILSTLITELTSVFLAPAPDGGFVISPLMLVTVQAAVPVLTIFLIHWLGRGMGGTGRLEDAILAVTWLQVVMLGLQLVQIVALALLPPLSGIVVIAGLALFLYLLTAFIAELHGFASMGRVFGMILFVLVGVALGLSFVLTLIGVTVPR